MSTGAQTPTATEPELTEGEIVERLSGYALALWEYGRKHDDPDPEKAAAYAVRRADR